MSNQWVTILIISLLLSIQSWFIKNEDSVPASAVQETLDMIKANNAEILRRTAKEDSLLHGIYRRDQMIQSLLANKDAMGDTITSILTDEFETASEERRDALIEEALNSIPE